MWLSRERRLGCGPCKGVREMKKNRIYSKLNTPSGIAELLALEDFSEVYEEADRVRKETWAI